MEVELAGRDVTDLSRRERIDAGMAYVPEDRQKRGLVMEFDLVENGLLGSQHTREFAEGGRIDWATTRDHAESVIEEYDVRPRNPDAEAESLSGGNQQKFVVGREFARDPEVVVASHPTRGVDVGSIEFIHDRILDLRERAEEKAASLGRKAGNARRLLTLLYQQPFVNAKDVAEHLDVTHATALSLLDDFEELELLDETTGRQRNRRYLFAEYFNLFTRD